MIRTILVPLAEDLQNEALLDAALALGRRLNAHIRATFIRPDPTVVRAVFPELLGGAMGACVELERRIHEAGADERRRFADWRARNHLPVGVAPGFGGCSASWSEPVGDVETIVTRLGRVNDLIVVQRPSSTALSAQRCFDAATFGSGRPTVVMPQPWQDDMIDHIMIAWNGSLQATRAVASALPLFHCAKRVSIFTALEYGADASDLGDLAETLRWHGIQTPEVFFPDKAASTGTALLGAVAKQEATMVVMGAYTHSRLRQSFLGGVTKHLLAHSAVPLVMCH
jgi:nucleotide-binding universal stress UspA family protein